MATLAEILLTDETRPKVERDCVALIEAEVSKKTGMSGFAIKAGFKTVKAFKRGIVPDVVSHLLPEFVANMEPFYAEHTEAGGGDITTYAVANDARIADALLSITDGRADRSRHKTLVKAYRKLRPRARDNVIAAMPGLGAVLANNGV